MCIVVKILTCSRTRLVIDWHNYGFTIMQVNNVNRRLVSIARWYELTLGRFGDFHLTVSEAMRQDLMRIVPQLRRREDRIQVLYDRATSKFQAALSMKEKCDLLARVNLNKIIGYSDSDSQLVIPTYLKDRPVLMLSSTSYTPDEDFMVLVNALDLYDADPSTRQTIQVVVTGRGPLREFYD